MQTSRPASEKSRLPGIILGLCALYCCLSAFFYLSDPLAMAPQLDARENLVLAKQIDEGSLPAEPFYRAMLYPAVLSLLPPEQGRIAGGLLLGLACHLLNGFLVFRLAGKIWKSHRSGTIATALYLLNPASLFFALQLLDVTFGISLFLGGLLVGLGDKGKALNLLGAGALLGLSTLARPHFLPAVLMAPAIFALWPTCRLRFTALAWIPIILLLGFQGLANHRQSGEFRMLPWQGSYNLWAANRPGANGLYFQQAMDMSGRGDDSNPAKAESIALYGLAHPELAPPYSIDEMNRFWRDKFLDRIAENPASFIGLCFFKAYAVSNTCEQYNNLTFSYHKGRLPWLKVNPLSWGILFIFAVLGGTALLRQNPRACSILLLLMAFYGISLLLYYASARFRLPLVPLMAVLAGGVPLSAGSLVRFPGKTAGVIAAIVLAGGITFSSFSGIQSIDTTLQDQLLLANANADLGRDREAALLSGEILEKSPGRAEALRIYAISYFNLRLLGQDFLNDFGDWEDQRIIVTQTPPTDTLQDAILGVYYWNWGEPDKARQLWEFIAPLKMQGSTMASTCLKVTRDSFPEDSSYSEIEKALHSIILPGSTDL